MNFVDILFLTPPHPLLVDCNSIVFMGNMTWKIKLKSPNSLRLSQIHFEAFPSIFEENVRDFFIGNLIDYIFHFHFFSLY